MRKISIFYLAVLIIGVSACTDYTTDEEILVSLKKDVAFLADDKLEGRAIGTQGEILAANYIAEEFEKLGLEPKGTDGYFQEFSVKKATHAHEETVIGTEEGGITGRNVAGFINNNAANTVVIGAHFDHLGYGNEGSLHRGDSAIHNGADDNASGTASIIQIARLLKNKKGNYNYLFLAFSGEESGLWGSNYFSKNSTVDLSTINYMINLDMVGRMNEENTVAISGVGTTPLWKERLNAVNTDSLKLVMTESGVGPSDHTSFYLQDLPVLHFFTGQHEDYHKPTDDSDKINYEGMLKVVHLIERLALSMDEEDKLAFVKTKDSTGRSSRSTVTLGVVPDYLFDGTGMRLDGVSDDKPAQVAGMQKGDIILQVGDSAILDMMSYMRALGAFKAGDQTIVKYKRGEELKSVEVEF